MTISTNTASPAQPVFLVDPTGNAYSAASSGGSSVTNPSTVVAGQAKIATTATAVQLPSTALVNGVVIKADPSNSAKMTIGGSGLTNTTDGTGNGYILAAGEAASFAVTNLSAIYINGTAGSFVSFEGN